MLNQTKSGMMKSIFLLLFLGFTVNSFGQVNGTMNLEGVNVDSLEKNPDTTFKVIHKSVQPDLYSGFVINGQFIKSLRMSSLDPDKIASITILKNDSLTREPQPKSLIIIQTKENRNFRLISLSELIEKYTDFKNIPVAITIDGDFVTEDFNTYYINMDNLLTIIVEQKVMMNGVGKMGLITLLTKTEENIKDRNQVYIR
jgi:hypothetical protein